MNGNDKHLEETFRKKLEGYSPEVPASVWEGISTQLPGSVSSVHSSGSGGLAAGIVQKLVIGLILSAGLVAGVLIYTNKETNETPIHQYRTGTAPEEIQLNAEETSNESDVKSTTITPGQATNPGELSNQPGDRTGPDSPTRLTSESTPIQAQPTPQFGASEVVVNQSAPGRSSQPLGTPSQTSPVGASAAAKAPLKLILSATAGFAPLRITAMNNLQGQAVEYSFPDGTTIRSAGAVSYECKESGTYTVCCSSGNEQSCGEVIIIGRIANVFSPNGDGVNDRFMVEGAETLSGSLRIFSRDGHLVFQSANLAQGWDGRLSDGNSAPEGTYIFDIFVGSSEAGPIHQKGTLQLFR